MRLWTIPIFDLGEDRVQVLRFAVHVDNHEIAGPYSDPFEREALHAP